MDRLVRRPEGSLEGRGRAVVCDGEDVEIRPEWLIRRESAVSRRRAVEHNGRWLDRGLEHTRDGPVNAEIPGVLGRIARNAGNLRALH